MPIHFSSLGNLGSEHRTRPPQPPQTPATTPARRAAAVARTLAWRAANEARGLPRTGYAATVPHYARALTVRQAAVLSAFHRAWRRANPLHPPAHAPSLVHGLSEYAPPSFPISASAIGAEMIPPEKLTGRLYSTLRTLHLRRWIRHLAHDPNGRGRRQHRYTWFDRSQLDL